MVSVGNLSGVGNPSQTMSFWFSPGAPARPAAAAGSFPSETTPWGSTATPLVLWHHPFKADLSGVPKIFINGKLFSLCLSENASGNTVGISLILEKV